MFQKLLSKLHLSPKIVQFIIGVTVLIKGLWLELDNQYFFYPPNLAKFLNNNYLDLFFIIIGLTLIVTAMIKPQDKDTKILVINITKIALVLAGVVMLWLALLQITHGIFTTEHQMGQTALGDLFIFATIALVAGDV